MQTQKQPVLSAVSPKHAPSVLMVPPVASHRAGASQRTADRSSLETLVEENDVNTVVSVRDERERESSHLEREPPSPSNPASVAR